MHNHFSKLILRPGVLVEVWIRKPLSPQLDRKILAKTSEERIYYALRRLVNRLGS